MHIGGLPSVTLQFNPFLGRIIRNTYVLCRLVEHVSFSLGVIFVIYVCLSSTFFELRYNVACSFVGLVWIRIRNMARSKKINTHTLTHMHGARERQRERDNAQGGTHMSELKIEAEREERETLSKAHNVY